MSAPSTPCFFSHVKRKWRILWGERNFVGRHEDLKRIAVSLRGGGTAAIGEVTVAASSGLGGVGKTQLACEFIHRYGRFFHGVYWLNFGNPAGIPAEVASCGGAGAMNGV